MHFFRRHREVLAEMDPERIYVENVRAFLGVRYSFAKWLCERACRDGLMEKWIALEHPVHGHVLFAAPADDFDPPEEVRCETSELTGEGQSVFAPEELKKVEYYRAFA